MNAGLILEDDLHSEKKKINGKERNNEKSQKWRKTEIKKFGGKLKMREGKESNKSCQKKNKIK